MSRIIGLLIAIYIGGVVVVLAMALLPQSRELTLSQAGSQIVRDFPGALRWPVRVFDKSPAGS
jgi:hypothetical protein